ncbi:MAG: pyridoxamine 5'-phosphate oxidase family protein [Chloroflexota bacterium]
MPDPGPEFGAGLARRMREESIIWFTTVSPEGVPSPNPVWFHWDGEYIIVYSQPASFRVRNIKNNPHVALTLQGVDGLGNNVVIINGEAELKPNNQTIPDAYWKKYRKLLQDMTAEGMTASYNVEIRVRPTRIRVE